MVHYLLNAPRIIKFAVPTQSSILKINLNQTASQPSPSMETRLQYKYKTNKHEQTKGATLQSLPPALQNSLEKPH